MQKQFSPGQATAAVATVLALAACTIVGTKMEPNARPTSEGIAPVPSDTSDEAVLERARQTDGRKILISLEQRRLWLVEGSDTLVNAPVAIGRGETFTYKEHTYHFATPTGRHQVLRKEENPIWTPPIWHYYEKAANRDLEVVKMERGRKYELSDGTHLAIRGDQVGRVNKFGNFWPWTPGMELVFDGTIYVPPFGTKQRDVPNALGPLALALGDGYLIHGTWSGNRDSVGNAASHGCVRMYNEDLKKLYGMVQVGTPVFIF